MASLSLSSVSLIADRPLVSELSFTLSSGERLGLIAINGGGKSTLLRCLAGEAEPTEGEIVRSRGASVALVPQEVPEKLLALPFAEVLRRAIAPERREDDGWRVDLALEEFQVPEEFRQKPMAELSGGWQRLALIARVWLTDPDFLLLDEPTNHLDLEKMTLLEDWLNGSARGVGLIVASHDRQFLDNCTEKTLFLRPEASRLYSHSFSKARELLAEDDEAHAVKLAKNQREVEKMLDQWRKLKNIGINSGSDYLQKRAAQMKNRADELEETLKERQIEKSADIRLANRGTHAKVLMTLENVKVATPDARPLFAVEKLFLRQGDRLVLLGANGVGKSQLVKLVLSALRGEEVPGLKFSPSVVPGYLDQLMSHLPPKETPLDFIAGLFRLGDGPSVKALAGAGFSPLLQGRRIEQLSPGQKSRLGLLAIRLTDPNLYLMDEPTNHVDIAGQERLEEEIIGRGATAILVSHDRRFVERVGTRFLLIERGKAREVER